MRHCVVSGRRRWKSSWPEMKHFVWAFLTENAKFAETFSFKKIFFDGKFPTSCDYKAQGSMWDCRIFFISFIPAKPWDSYLQMVHLVENELRRVFHSWLQLVASLWLARIIWASPAVNNVQEKWVYLQAPRLLKISPLMLDTCSSIAKDKYSYETGISSIVWLIWTL